MTRSTTCAVQQAAEAVAASGFIEDLPGGYDAPVAERGATLSTGQKQLLSFARALAFNRRVLILDEATSSIDTETEVTIRQALEVLMQGRTTIAIAHRLSTIQDMDRDSGPAQRRGPRVGHAPVAAGRARHLLPAVPAAVPAHGLSALPCDCADWLGLGGMECIRRFRRCPIQIAGTRGRENFK